MLLHSSLYLCFGYFLKHIVWKMTIDCNDLFMQLSEKPINLVGLRYQLTPFYLIYFSVTWVSP